MLAVPSHPWALRPTALKVRRSRRPSVRVREGRGPAGQGFQKVSMGNFQGCPRPTSPALMLMIGEAIVFGPGRHCRDTATRFARSHQPARFRELGRGCGEISSQVSRVSPPRQPQTTRHMSVPHYHSSPWPWTRRSRRSSPRSQKIGQVVYQRKRDEIRTDPKLADACADDSMQ